VAVATLLYKICKILQFLCRFVNSAHVGKCCTKFCAHRRILTSLDTPTVYPTAGLQNMLPSTHSEATRATRKNRNAPAFYCRHRPTGRVAGHVWLATCGRCCYYEDSCCRPPGSTVYPLCCRMLQPHSSHRDAQCRFTGATCIPTALSTNIPMAHYVSTSQHYYGVQEGCLMSHLTPNMSFGI